MHLPLHVHALYAFVTCCRLVGDPEADSADLWLLNTCTVKSPSQVHNSQLGSGPRVPASPLLARLKHSTHNHALTSSPLLRNARPCPACSLLWTRFCGGGASRARRCWWLAACPRYTHCLHASRRGYRHACRCWQERSRRVAVTRLLACPPAPSLLYPTAPMPTTQGDRRAAELRGLSLLGVTQIDRVVEAVEETLKGHTVQMLAKKALPRLDLPKVGFFSSPSWLRVSSPAAAAQDGTVAGRKGWLGVTGCSAVGGWPGWGLHGWSGGGAGSCSELTSWLFAAHPLPSHVQVRRNRHVEILPLSTGCLGACTVRLWDYLPCCCLAAGW